MALVVAPVSAPRVVRAILLSLLFVSLCFTAAAAAATEPLTESTFASRVVDSDDAWVVEFYSERCGSCAEFAPTFAKAAAEGHGVRWGKVNIDDKSGMALADELGALEQGIPAVLAWTRAGERMPSTPVFTGVDLPNAAALGAMVTDAMKKGSAVQSASRWRKRPARDEA